MTRICRDDRSAELYAGHLAADDGEQGQCVVARALRHPGRVESPSGDTGEPLDHLVDGAVLDARKEDAKVHERESAMRAASMSTPPHRAIRCAAMDSPAATIHAALQRAVTQWGDRDFIVTPDRRMTYREAEVASRRLAKRMVAAGIGKGTRVGVYLTYGQEWVVTWLAASRIGALFMPLATTYRPAEIAKILRLGDVDTLITARTVLRRDMEEMLEAS